MTAAPLHCSHWRPSPNPAVEVFLWDLPPRIRDRLGGGHRAGQQRRESLGQGTVVGCV